jgi:energy-converting hydrogenase Eha subunit G
MFLSPCLLTGFRFGFMMAAPFRVYLFHRHIGKETEDWEKIAFIFGKNEWGGWLKITPNIAKIVKFGDLGRAL